ncbi:acyl-CoA dehydrogenase family protein [Gloeothece verrucosa]|uniref:Acyl-CoA dehydrogenase domain protein n=1 Tax=Gloeothece verrucosa (strain PCC 7822) TaxID=497965 RepID=E0ULB0_GLOV7|nr:acyl-CoA dehydrogenase family protein [Gloeothece verrucosa]ADN17740.1 acyl-CoA dehydrogenase domain protein [Gloeothece verrucosa PCC 7822]
MVTLQSSPASDDTSINSQMSQQKANDLISWVRTYANKRINSRLIDERRCIPPYIILDFGNQGLLGMQVQKKYGGLALTNVDSLRVVEQLAGIDIALATFVVINSFLGIRTIERYATDTFREEILSNLATGRELAAFALTEPGAGSNPRAISATGIMQQQGQWLLQGQKSWIGLGSWAGVVNVFVQLYDEQNKPAGITGFAVRQLTPGLNHGLEALTMGMRGIVQNAVHLEDVLVNETNLLGQIGSGMTVAQDVMLYTRLAIAAKSVGAMKRCAQLMLKYATGRDIGTGKLMDNPVTLVRMSNLTAAITAVETLVYGLAELLDRGVSVPTEAYIACKTSGPEFLGQAADDLIQLLGGRGYIETNIAPQILRDARIFRIFEGPTETLNMFFGSSLVRPRKELERFFCEQLAAVDLWNDLTNKLQEIYERWSVSVEPFANKSSARSWAFTLMGELGTYGFLLAMLQGKYNVSPSPELARAITWTQAQFDFTFSKALKGSPVTSAYQNADENQALISSYTESIGELEQTLPGEDYALDYLLKQ